jgi:tRNA (guanine37-N1)-methyltransferase
MVMMAGPLEAALESIAPRERRFVVYPSPQGTAMSQELVEDLRGIAETKRLVIVCGHYEGVDERFVERNVDLEVSMGDFVLTGGELPALAITDAVSRLIPGVVGRFKAVTDDSFFSGMLDHPHYTRPEDFDGDVVPKVLIEGDHEAIARFRRLEARRRTLSRRPDMLSRAGIMPYLDRGVYVLELHHQVLDRNGHEAATAITGMDLHDISRACHTYGVRKYIVVTPIEPQREMIKKVASHWISGYGAEFNPDRSEAMGRIKAVSTLDRALEWIEGKEKTAPFTIATTARGQTDSRNWTTLKATLLRENRPAAFIFGTGSGLCERVISSCDAVLSPISGSGGYNHLSVRSAVSIVLDRFFGFR